MNQLLVNKRSEWREWLKNNHSSESEVWLVYFKKGSGKISVSYDESVEEALCFGWIDGIKRKIDEEKYSHRFTSRKDKSNWSASNKKRVEKLIRENRMTAFGLEKIKIAKENGQWDKPEKPHGYFAISKSFQEALHLNKKAKDYFDHLAPGYQKQFFIWIAIAKRQQTKERRIKEAIALLEKGLKLGMK